ncbi:protein serine/threonine kinase, putative [Entamoeba invadens IP1]|uniref:Protein serine/threonine kinase, putative n=1 Tax=Entamoeba invadens IP1 TaxID=370355 RepID=L7FM48_ENTIV|nr:protein serine/threonine kinase, putative [Entamoeba invadens IP1]ELP87709.1 protein serine/threonine kinase, putative [Entamoeba invadens IP1]|eukprot:XP_004254480.1 protein serine/threonine kinase, putative [Entamoeba invadens IP1]
MKTCNNCFENVITTNGNCLIESTCKYQLTHNDQTVCLIHNNNTQEGIKANNCKYTQNEFCYLANEGYHTTFNTDGNTANCEDAEICQIVNGYIINISCKSEFVMTTNGLCSQDFNCANYSGSVCTTCQQNHHIANGGCVSNDNECVIQNKEICILCSNNKITVDGKCVLTDSIKCKEQLHTEKFKGCLRCGDGYYISNSVCVRCEYPCTHCSNLKYCTKCDAYSYTKNGKCFEINEILGVCDVMMSTYEGCVACKDGYMRSSDGKQCVKCDTSCKTCSNDGDYRLEQLFEQDDEWVYIVRRWFALKDNLCYKCGENCTTCDATFECLKCGDNNILKDSVCVHFSQIQNCISSQNSLCWECADGYKLSDDKIECFANTNYGVVVGLPVVCVAVLVVIIISIVIIVFLFVLRKKDNKHAENVCVFKMSRSNIMMTKLDGDILSNKNMISFGDEDDKICIETESRELLCVGNSSKSNVKIQITTKDKCDKYKIRTEPQIVTLKSGFACEFEVFITPYCTMDLTDEVMIVSLDLKGGKQNTTLMNIKALVEQSTRLDYDEIKTEKKLGEGSFGIVYKGTYRENVVAVKKMKHVDNSNDEIGMIEFTKEVEMLDKFRSEYIVHFYGAVFIPNKTCMVTEFAQYGSLQDLITTKRMTKDIKPDNILVFTFDVNDKVNAKLTDFGSARNINLLMTNMTFTKGIGTPVYMAPEVLKKEKYTKSADIFSFGVTMYEVFGWTNAYPLDAFKFPWKIAEFVICMKIYRCVGLKKKQTEHLLIT